MAKSKSGGTRSYLRGRIASDVYSIGHDANGNKQQVVRSLAEQVKNPQTRAQMRGRMIMSTIMQALSVMKPIIDHSFDGIMNGQPCLSEFIRRNYELIKADVAAHPSTGNKFGLNKYQEKGAKPGAYVISAGDVIVPSWLTGQDSVGTISCGIKVPADNVTAGIVRNIMGMGKDDYFTVCGITKDGLFIFYRVHVSSELSDDTAITSENVSKLFNVENPYGLNITFDSIPTEIQILDTSLTEANGVIFTRKISGSFSHSTCTLNIGANPEFTADVALDTYPEGKERFLNGGDL